MKLLSLRLLYAAMSGVLSPIDKSNNVRPDVLPTLIHLQTSVFYSLSGSKSAHIHIFTTVDLDFGQPAHHHPSSRYVQQRLSLHPPEDEFPEKPATIESNVIPSSRIITRVRPSRWVRASRVG